MDTQAATLLSTLKRPAASSDSKLALLNTLKSDIKHYRVPESAQGTIFECIKLAITQQASSNISASAFSTLGHLVKRLKIQDASGQSIVQLAPRLWPAIHDRLGDTRESTRAAASQAMTDLYPFLTTEVETMIRDDAIAGSNPRARQAGIQWVLKMHQEEAMPFKSYVQAIVARLEDSDGTVRETAKNVLIELFRDAPERAKADLKKQLKVFSVRLSIESQILAQITSPASLSTSQNQPALALEHKVDMLASTRSMPNLAASINSEAAQPPPQEVVKMDPIYVQSRSELDEIFRDMPPHFEGKETEQNWTPRDKSILKLRRLTKGNAPSEYHQAFMAGIKSVMDGILKVANSLRTTMSTNGCQLVQELARTLGPAMDPHVEVLLQSFIKMSAVTKHIAAEAGKMTCDAIFQNCSYKHAMMQHIWYAAQDKNAQTRMCAPEWLKTILRRQSSYKQHFDGSGGLELAEKCIKKGLEDPKPEVKESMRAAYWTFAKGWPDKASAVMSTLDPKSKTALERDSNNPHAALHASQSSNSGAGARATGAASRNALREMMAEQRKAKAAGLLPDRPSSAMAQLSPARPRVPSNLHNGARVPSNLHSSSRPEARVVSSTLTATATPGSAAAKKGASLMSGPVRRPRRPEIARPQTADPYASKRPLRPETPAESTPGNSPPKGTGTIGSKHTVTSSSVAKNRAKAPANAASPSASPAKRSSRPSFVASAGDSRPTSKGSAGTTGEDLSSVREDDFTMVMPQGMGTASRSGFVSGHKRGGAGQAMSMDSGIPHMAEEEGFTMVLPNLPSHSLPSRNRSPLAYRSPLKAMFEEAREMVESFEPRAERSVEPEERAAPPRSISPIKLAPMEDVQIYEDPFVANDGEGPTDGERKVLGELPVNENVRLQSPTQSPASGDGQGSPRNLADVRSPLIATAQDRAEVQRNRRLLGAGIDRIRAKTLDAHGFRRVQDVAKSELDIWEGGKKYTELMGALVEYLQTFDEEPRFAQLAPSKAAGLKVQALGLTRTLLQLHKKQALAWHAQVLVGVLACRRGVDGSGHVVAEIEKTAADIVARAESSAATCIDAIVQYLPSVRRDRSASRSTAMALTLLRQLLSSAKTHTLDLGPERKIRLVQTTAKFLDDREAEVRKADVELASELFELFGSSKAEFWNEFKGTDEGRLGLLTYYIARRGRAAA